MNLRLLEKATQNRESGVGPPRAKPGREPHQWKGYTNGGWLGSALKGKYGAAALWAQDLQG